MEYNIDKKESNAKKLKKEIIRGSVKCLTDIQLLSLLFPNATKLDNLAKVLDKNINIDYSAFLDVELEEEEKIRAIALLEFSRRRNPSLIKVKCSEDVYKLIRHYALRKQEQFIIISLNSAYEIISNFVATVGLVDKVIIDPREVFSSPLEKKASAIIIAHNHPSGNLTPSKQDINITNRIVQSGALLGIDVLDHIIFSQNSYLSFLAEGLIKAKAK